MSRSTVDHPAHYNQSDGIECIDVAENMNFNLGNVIKYVWRSGHKSNGMEDLEKARWYINREIDRQSRLIVRGDD